MKYNYRLHQIIRHKKTAHPYLILQMLKPYFLVCDLENKQTPVPTLVILIKDIKYFVPDSEMKDEVVEHNGYWTDPTIQFKVKRYVQI